MSRIGVEYTLLHLLVLDAMRLVKRVGKAKGFRNKQLTWARSRGSG
jgi:hypothetical protein